MASMTGPRFLNHDDVTRLHGLSRQLRRQAADLAAAEYRWLVALEEFDRDGGYALEGAKTMTAWLSWACGISGQAARERVRVARALPGLPLVSASFAQGRLSFSKARAITRVATTDTEELLVCYAEHATAAQLEEVVRGFRRVTDPPQDLQPDGTAELAQREHRWVRWWTDDHGHLRISAQLPADDATLVIKALESVADDLAEQPADDLAQSSADGDDAHGALVRDPIFGVGDRPVASKRWATPEPAEVRRADALRILAETTLAHGPAALSGDDRYQVTVVVRPDALTTQGADDSADRAVPGPAEPTVSPTAPRGGDGAQLPAPPPGEPWPAPQPPAAIDGGPGLPAATAQRIACDATLIPLVEDALGQPLGVGRRTRVVPRRLRRALTRRDRGCRFPGCATTRHVDAHHIRHWAHGGPTDVDNLILVCRFHHTLIHEGNFTIHTAGPGRHTFHRPDGTLIATTAPTLTGHPGQLIAANRAHGVDPTPDTLIPDWDGTPQDIDAAVAALADLAITHQPHAPDTAGGASAEAPAEGSTSLDERDVHVVPG